MWELIKRQTIIVLLLIMLFFGGVLFYHNYTSQILDKEVEEKAWLSVNNLTLGVTSYFSEIEHLLQTTTLYIEQEPTQSELLDYLISLLESTPIMTSLYYGTSDNTMVNASGFIPPPEFDLRTRPWYIKALEEESLIYTDAFLNASSDKIIVTLAIPVYIDEVFEGVLAADVDIKTISQMISLEKVGNSGYVILLDSNGQILAHPSLIDEALSLIDINTLSTEIQLLYNAQETNELTHITLGNVEGVLLHQIIQSNSWFIGVFIPESDFHYNAILLFNIFIATTILLFIVMMGTLILLRKVISRPLVNLENEINRINIESNQDYRLTVKPKITFLKLRTSLNHVLDVAQDYYEILINKMNQLDVSNKDLENTQIELTHEYEKFTNLVNSFEDVVYELDLNQKHTAVYGRWLEKNQIDESMFIGKTARDMFGSELAHIHEEAFKKALSKGKALYEWHTTSKDKTIYYQTSLSAIHNQEGIVTGMLGIGRNISERKAMEENIIESEKRYRIVTSVSNIGVWEYNHETKETWCSPEYFSMLGYQQNDFKEGITFDEVWLKLMHPEDLEEASNQFSNYIKSQSEKLYENFFRLRKKDNTYAWIWSRGHTLYNESNEPTTLTVGTHIDMTEQKQRQDEIEYLSTHDYLTGLYNRRLYAETLGKLDHKHYYPLVIMMFDLNGLKLINDAFGHAKGDEALIKISGILKMHARQNDIVARIGGDEFAMVLPKTSAEIAESIKNSIQKEVSKLNTENVFLSVAIGYEIKFDGTESIKTILKKAEDFMYKRKIIEGRSTKNTAIQGILKTLTDKFEEEKNHSERVSKICEDIGKALKLKKDDIEELKLAGLLHDIGKISIPDDILDKPSELTSEEYDIIKKHTFSGYQILRAADAYSDLAEYAVTHHERIDGLGYPNGLKGNEIPYFSKIIAVADAYEAMTSNRTYRKAIEKEDAIKELLKHSGTQFDASIVKVFIEKVLK